MRTGKVHQAEEDEEEEQAPSSHNRDGKNNDKATTTRSKHSVTEQRRRSKINERFQILRDLIPHSDQKRDTASFLLEVIEYVQYLQKKVQKYEGSFQEWNSEPTKLMPWRNSHWRVQSFGGPIQLAKNDGGAASTFPGRFDDNEINASRTMPSNQLNDSISTPGGSVFPNPLQSNEIPITSDALNQQEDLMIEGGTISIRSIYTQGLLNNINQALQNAGVDLSQASVSVQIDIGKRANREPAYGGASTTPKDAEGSSVHHQTGQYMNSSNGLELNQAPKRPKI